MKKQILVSVVMLTSLLIQSSIGSICNLANECKLVNLKSRQIAIKNRFMKCSLKSSSQIRFTNQIENNMSCKISNITQVSHLLIRPKSERSIKLEKGMIDLIDLNGFLNALNTDDLYIYFQIHLQHFKGFDLNLFDETIDQIYNSKIKYVLGLYLEYNTFEFYLGQKKLISCQDIIEATNYSNPLSIFQFFSKMYISKMQFNLGVTKNRICPLVFKNSRATNIGIIGENSFYSKRVLSFSNESFNDLNSNFYQLMINAANIEIDKTQFHPDVFNRTVFINFQGKVKKIHPNVLNKLNNLKILLFQNKYLRNLMHESGMEWLKSFNRDINWDIENFTQLYEYREMLKTVYLECITYYSPPLVDIFPEEDFCLYKDFPINQLVVIVETCDEQEYLKKKWQSPKNNDKIPCTFLWITRSYKVLFKLVRNEFMKEAIISLLNSSEYKSIEKCNFEQKLQLCNKSNFEPKQIRTTFEIDQAMLMTQSIINILSYILSIFGIVTNLLVIITISSKKNKEEFKDIKQYDYLRLNSICSCLILIIHLISWLNECVYPFQVFCPIIRKTVFMQWFKIIVEETLMTALQFMNNFTYIGFAFNRISLIGKDHNKLVKFMSDLGIKKYIAFSLFLSIGLSVIKVFEYDINPGKTLFSYPISYDYVSSYYPFSSTSIFFILIFVSDLLNHVVFLLINLAIDIGMIVKLRQTLNERIEKAKTYSTQTQLEAKNQENENAMNNAKSMIIWNTTLNLAFKLPTTIYSLFYLYYSINISNEKDHLILNYFYRFICIDADFCSMFLQLSNFLYFLCISIQLFFYKHYDKKFSRSFNMILVNKKSNSLK